MLSLTIDGRKVQVDEGLTILEAAREAGVEIPNLCYHEALEPVGSCRLCTVEVRSPGRERCAAACVTPAEEGMVVLTASERVVNIRRTLVELLLARCKDVKVLQKLAAEYGVGEPRYQAEDNDCILCGMCVRACREIVGVDAIGIAHRGVESEVLSPFSQGSGVCIGCGTCTTVCPVHTFTLDKVRLTRSMHLLGGEDHGNACKVCSDFYPVSAP